MRLYSPLAQRDIMMVAIAAILIIAIFGLRHKMVVVRISAILTTLRQVCQVALGDRAMAVPSAV